MRCTSVIIADRQPVVLHGLKKLLEESDFNVVACCSDSVSCIKAIRTLAPNIAILGTSMPGLSALEILAIVNSESLSLSTRLVFFTGSAEQRELLKSAGATVILKDVPSEILLQSLRQIACATRPRPTTEQAQALERSNIARTEKVLAALTERERQIMRLVSEGLSNKAIGRRLNIADGTIKVHLHNIYEKLEIKNYQKKLEINHRTLLAALAISLNDRREARRGDQPTANAGSQEPSEKRPEPAAISPSNRSPSSESRGG
jgi:two-component system, NarL family, nitrate/nitrite response regulator NarL